MNFNNDLLFVSAASFFIVGGVILTYSFYNDIFPTVNKGESLINTNSIPKLDSNIQLDNLPHHDYVDAVVQTEVNIQVEASIQTATSYVNTGMQTSARMWLESIKNWIDNLLSTPNPQASGPQYVDVGVQTNGPSLSLWSTIKQWFLEVYSIRSSELSSIGYNKVTKWRKNLNSDQSVDLHNSESPLTTLKFGSESELQQLVNPDDSASNKSEIEFEGPVRVYDMNNVDDVLDLMIDPTVVFTINSATLSADDLITFYTADSTNEILRSTLEALLTSVN